MHERRVNNSETTPPGRVRWLICLLLFFSVAINYVDRLVIGILKQPLSNELGWSERDYGLIAAGFSFAYAFGYLLGGWSIDRLGVRKGLPLFVFLWSVAAAAHGLVSLIGREEELRVSWPSFLLAERAAATSTLVLPMTAAGFILARIALGLTEGANFPAAIKTVAEWFPTRERALAIGWFNAGTNVGAILCPIAVPWMYARLGWPATFYITGGLGLLWLIGWARVYDDPDHHPWLGDAERRFIRGGQPSFEEPTARLPWRSILTHRSVWAFIIASILAGPAWGFYQFFVPDFLGKRFGLSLVAAGWWTGVFFALAAVGGVAGGWLADRLLRSGCSLNAGRKLTLLVCALAVLPVCLAPFAPGVLTAVLLVGLAGAAHQGWSANLYGLLSDCLPKAAISSAVGLGGFLCYFTGGFVNGVTGLLLERTGSYVPVFAYFSVTYLVSLACIQWLVPQVSGADRPVATA
jgi:ACS family hexuronate transporter-like MFS transporter